MLVLLTTLTCLQLAGVKGENILFLYFPSFSHIRGALNVASELASRGHVVWNAVPSFIADDERLQVPGVQPLVYKSVDDFDMEKEVMNKEIDHFFETGQIVTPFDNIKQVCTRVLQDAELFNEIKSLDIDLVVLSSNPLARLLTILPYKLDLPFIFMGACFEPYASRTPFVLSTFPFMTLPWTPQMDFKTRLVNSLMVSSYWLYDPFSYYWAVSDHAPEKPYISVESLTAKGQLWLLELEPFLQYPQAVLPNVKYIGSLTNSEPKKLPDNYQTHLDRATEGAVIVSFGSNVNKIPKVYFDRLMEAFLQTSYSYVFKSDGKPELRSNVMLTNWMPQADLLAHPNTKLFITHCGANGQNEAFVNGVPMLGLPMFAEQHFNAEKFVYKGFGVRLDFLKFTVEELISNINEVIQNTSYSTRIKKAAEITKLRPRSPKAEAVYWIEHLLQYGGDHLRSYCQDMPLYQYLNLDVIGLLLVIIHLSLYLIWKLFSFCCRKSCWRQTNKMKQE